MSYDRRPPMYRLRCEYCHMAENQFVHDTRTDDTICTNCGVVVRNFMFGQLLGSHTYSVDTSNIEPRSFGGHSTQLADISSPSETKVIHRRPNASQAISSSYSSYAGASKGTQSKADKKTEQSYNRLMDRVFRDDVRDRHLHAKLYQIVESMGDMDKRVYSRAAALIRKFPKIFAKRRYTTATLVATVIVVRNSLGLPANLREAEAITGTTNISKAVSKLCKLTNISQKAGVVKSIPYIRTHLGLDFQDEKKIRKLFIENSRHNGSVGSFTLLAVTLFNYLSKDYTRLDDIAYITCTSKVSLLNYIDGRKRDSLRLASI